MGLWGYADLRGHRGANGVHLLAFTSLHGKVIMHHASCRAASTVTGPEVESDSPVAWRGLELVLGYLLELSSGWCGRQVANVPRDWRSTSHDHRAIKKKDATGKTAFPFWFRV